MERGFNLYVSEMSGQLQELRHWRPITLLNVIYKILVKTLARRLQPHLSELIHESQTGFMQERSIFDNIILFWEMVAFAELHLSKTWQYYYLILKKLMKKCIGTLWSFT